ncbi:hypothetical protein [Nocardia abscessus]|uniref:hypothetical protein n=1 Tax=Nocardia abscessus TaxID=120957 RepID=UPI00245760F8|nr:hypothetical protein [Nocardia abscessus]
MAGYGLVYLLSVTWFESIGWRRRALDAEKPFPPTSVVHDYSTVGAANIARLVEHQRREELRQAGQQW